MTDTEKIVRCAEILGFDRIGPRPSVWHWPQGWLTVSSRPYAELDELPQVLTDANAALELIEWMRKKGWCCDIHCGRDGKWNIHFWKLNEWARKEGPVGFGDSFCEAVVNAFLKANKHISDPPIRTEMSTEQILREALSKMWEKYCATGEHDCACPACTICKPVFSADFGNTNWEWRIGPVKHTREFWLNFYKDSPAFGVHETRESADKYSVVTPGRIACKHITVVFEEGEGL